MHQLSLDDMSYRVSVGLLGVIVELTLAIVPDEVIHRDLDIVR